MKIIRDGKEITLTNDEVEKAYRERERYYYVEDVKMQWKQLHGEDFPYGDDVADGIAERAENILSKNDNYWESYWDNIYFAIEEFEGDNE